MLAVLLTRFAELSVSLGSVFVSNSSIRISVIVDIACSSLSLVSEAGKASSLFVPVNSQNGKQRSQTFQDLNVNGRHHT